MTIVWRLILFAALCFPAVADVDDSRSRTPVRTLKEAYFGALKNNERITISAESVREAEAVYRQTLGDALPEFTYRRTVTRKDRAGSTPERMFRLSKTDLTGYRELAELRADKSTVSQRVHERRRAEQLLLSDIAAAFYGYVQSAENISATNRLVELAQERLRELQKRVRVGRTREADAIGQDFQISTLFSQIEESERLLESRRNLLSFLADAPVGPPKLSDTGAGLAADKLPPLDSYLERIDTRPDVRAAAENRESARALLDAARADRLPQLDATANYYTDRPTSNAGNDWDVALTVDVPVFDWAKRKGAVDEAASGLKQRDEELRAARRLAELEIRNAYRDYTSARKQMDIRKKSVDLARRDYEFQARDDRQGLVTSLEVIESLNRLNAAELAQISARIQERLAAINLEIAAGSRPEDILQ